MSDFTCPSEILCFYPSIPRHNISNQMKEIISIQQVNLILYRQHKIFYIYTMFPVTLYTMMAPFDAFEISSI